MTEKIDIPKVRRGRFITPRSASFFDGINRELNYIQGQSILLYQYSGEMSQQEDIYREKKYKAYENPVLIPCNVGIDPLTSSDSEGYGSEKTTNLQLYIQITELDHISNEEEKKIYPNEGDVVVFKQRIFQIDNVDDSEMYSGSPEYPYTLFVECKKIRKSKINIDFPVDFY